ncbi:hypothetical protein HYV86_04120 [Candidatus Woesearchaeota archaeon]|nr:hypothetical protein [Candidatus Woesearchaeota archaeon]
MVADVDISLRSLFGKLAQRIDDQRDLGEVALTAILDSQLTFTSTSGDLNERRFQEVRAMYGVLTAVIAQIDGGSSIVTVRGDLYQKIEAELLRYQLGPQNRVNTNGSLYGPEFETLLLRPRSIPDRLCKDGLRLYHAVTNERVPQGTRNILNHDYRLVERTLRDGK